ncbi:putative transporter MCH1 [Silene latifolia]|uniref:putative transporter MCH1 n=1 Tax=Silene latifolia TaxID=37657 RepID=UPI003D780B67
MKRRPIDLVVVNRQPKREKRFFNDILYMSLALAGFILVMLILERKFEFNKGGYLGSFIGIMALLVLPLFLVFREEWTTWKARGDLITTSPAPKVNTVTKESETKDTPCFKDVFNPPPSGEDHTILQATFSIDMQILFIATICGIGGHLTTIDNLGQIGTALGYSKKSISSIVSLFGIWQYLGRVMGGLISEYLLTKYKWPQPVSLTAILFLSCIGHLLIAFNVPYGLYISSVIIGFCFGAEWTYLYAIISELFGLKYYATLYNYGSLAAPLGSYIFNVRVAGHLYDKVRESQLKALGITRGPGQALNCNGVKCFQLSYIIITAATFFSAIVSLISCLIRLYDYIKNI